MVYEVIIFELFENGDNKVDIAVSYFHYDIPILLFFLKFETWDSVGSCCNLIFKVYCFVCVLVLGFFLWPCYEFHGFIFIYAGPRACRSVLAVLAYSIWCYILIVNGISYIQQWCVLYFILIFFVKVST